MHNPEGYARDLRRVTAKIARQRRALADSLVERQLLIRQATDSGSLGPARVARLTGLNPSRIHQIRNA